jgi:hypothetical protein
MFSTPLKYYNALSDFYHMLFGFAVLQVASYYIAILAQEHSKLILSFSHLIILFW